MKFGKKLSPEHSLRMAYRIKGTRQKIIVTHNPSKIDQDQFLTLKFLNLGSDDIIIPGMVNLSFNTELCSMTNPNRMLVSKHMQSNREKLGS